jgi:uncharacterized protein (DUF849 family)
MLSEVGPDSLPWNPTNYRPLIINVALTGAVPSKSDYPSLPITVEEIVQDIVQCAEAGAQVFHIHLRDTAGAPTQDFSLYEELMFRVREEAPAVIICATTSSRASSDTEDRFIPLRTAIKPEMASLSLGSFNFPHSISRNSPNEIEALAIEMQKAGIRPELEVFEPGMLGVALAMLKNGIVTEPLSVNILLGNKGTSAPTTVALAPFLSQLPENTEWALGGIGRFQRKTAMLSIALGGNVRVGMEDDPRGSGKPGWSNLDAVLFAKTTANLLGRPLASVAEARLRIKVSEK